MKVIVPTKYRYGANDGWSDGKQLKYYVSAKVCLSEVVHLGTRHRSSIVEERVVNLRPHRNHMRGSRTTLVHRVRCWIPMEDTPKFV